MEQEINELLEKHLKEALGNHLKIQAVNTLGGGCINHASRVVTNEGTFFAKWNANGPEDMFLREAECLEELIKATNSIKVPAVMVKTPVEENQPGFLVTEYLEPPANNKNKKGHDRKLGQGLAEIHQFTSQQFGFYHNNYCGSTLQDNTWNKDWVNFFGSQRIWHLVLLIQESRGISNKEFNLYEKFFDELPGLINHQPEPALNHGDLWAGNYMYTQEGPAIIDPACSYSDREFDLAIMNMFGGFSSEVWQAYQEALPLAPGWKERNNIYMLYHVLNHYFLFGGFYGHEALDIVKRYVG